jgi:Fe-Mn family superoxide dismutase
MAFELPKLKYEYSALEPYIDALTMEIHHAKHHGAYTLKLNSALEESGETNKSIEDIMSGISKYSAVIRNNGGGYYNHKLFWDILKPKGGGTPNGKLAGAINKKYHSFENFKNEFSSAAVNRFGSGWAWLIRKTNGEVEITSTPNQDNPLMDIAEVKGTPILGLDVWEHAYYLKYQNRRPEYIEAFWNIIDWEEVERKYIQ